MKKIYTSLLLLHLVLYPILANADWQWAPEGTIWIYQDQWYSIPEYLIIERVMISAGDTLINGVDCRKIDFFSITKSNEGAIKEQFDGYEIVCYQDSVIYHFDRIFEELNPLYDFTLKIGDTILVRDSNKAVSTYLPADLLYSSHFESVVTNISDSQYIYRDSMYLRTFKMFPTETVLSMFPEYSYLGYNGNANPLLYHNLFSNSGGSSYVIENIGSTSWFFGTNRTFYRWFGNKELIICYKDPYTKIIFHEYYIENNLACEPKAFLLSLNNSNKEFNKLKLYPNPVVDQLNIEFNSKNEHIIYELIDIHGQILIEGKFESGSVFDLSLLSSGIYIFKIQDNDFIYYEKKIKN